jgi:hypothetical protein
MYFFNKKIYLSFWLYCLLHRNFKRLESILKKKINDEISIKKYHFNQNSFLLLMHSFFLQDFVLS